MLIESYEGRLKGTNEAKRWLTYEVKRGDVVPIVQNLVDKLHKMGLI
jgi:hypothetical protein